MAAFAAVTDIWMNGLKTLFLHCLDLTGTMVVSGSRQGWVGCLMLQVWEPEGKHLPSS